MRRTTPLALALLLAVTASPVPALAKDPSATGGTARATTRVAPPSTADRWIVVLRDGASVTAATTRARSRGVTADRTFRSVVHGFAAHLDSDQLAELRTDPAVAEVVPDEVISIAGQSVPTGVRRVGATESLAARIDATDGDVGDGQRVDADVAIVDTGIDSTHPDLNVVGGISCSTSNPAAWGTDINGHGTHVAGTVGALDNGIGVVGVAPGVRLWSVRIFDAAGNGLLSWYICGLDWITAQRDPVDPARPLFEAVNISAVKTGEDDHNCGLTNKDVMHQAVCRVVASGVTVVAAAGNNHFNAAKLRPASYDEVITVSALADSDGKSGGSGGSLCYSWGSYDRDDTFADFSNYGADVDLIAPGKCILSTLPGNRYGTISGTSMAAPLVTGAAALYVSSRPSATPAQVRLALRAAGNLDWDTATDPDPVHEPLLDVSHIVPLGDFTVDATPGTSQGARASAAGRTIEVPIAVVRAEDFGDEVTLTVSPRSPLQATLRAASLTGLDGVASSMTITVPRSTPSGTYRVTVTASDGSRNRSSSYPVVVDSVRPTVPVPLLALRPGTTLSGGTIAARGLWTAASDAGGSIAAYEVRWRVDGVLAAPAILSATARQATRTFAVGHTYSIRLRAKDRVGNWSDARESVTYTPSVSQDTSPTLDRSSGWTRTRSSSLSGGSALYAKRARASVTRSFTGRAIGFVTTRGPTRGKAWIYLDGQLVRTVDLRRSATQYRYLAFTRSWSTTRSHTLRVVVVGTSGRPRVDVDAFVITR